MDHKSDMPLNVGKVPHF